jgi:hypothetical protein
MKRGQIVCASVLASVLGGLLLAWLGLHFADRTPAPSDSRNEAASSDDDIPVREERPLDADVGGALSEDSSRPSTEADDPDDLDDPAAVTLDRPRDGSESGSDPLDMEELKNAIADALDEENWATVGELLASALTEQGSRFTLDDLPVLFESLGEVGDEGVQELILVHLRRIEAPPELLVAGYIGCLSNRERFADDQAIMDQLVALGGEAAVDGLVEILEDSPAMPMTRAAANALGKLAHPRALPALTSLLDEAAPLLAEDAVKAIAEIREPEAARVLSEYALRNPDSPAGARAAREAAKILRFLEDSRPGGRAGRRVD